MFQTTNQIALTQIMLMVFIVIAQTTCANLLPFCGSGARHDTMVSGSMDTAMMCYFGVTLSDMQGGDTVTHEVVTLGHT